MSDVRTTKKMTPRELVEEYDRVSKEVNALEKYRSSLGNKLTEYMTTKGLDQLEGHEHAIKLYQNSREIVTRKSLPPELWSQYATRVTYPRIYISKLRESKNNK